MIERFGDRTSFALEVGERVSANLRVVDLWAAGKWLTIDDNVAFLPSFVRCLRSSAARVRRRDVQPCPFPDRAPEEVFALLEADQTEFRERFCLMTWGETVDNLSTYAWLHNDHPRGSG